MGKWEKGARSRAKELSDIYTDEQAMQLPSIFPPWESEVGGMYATYAVGDRVRYNNTLWRCVKGHTVQGRDWTPENTPALWARMDDPAIEWPDWIQPDSTNPYALGAKVTHKGKRWVSTHPANVWEPGAYGWEEQKT